MKLSTTILGIIMFSFVAATLIMATIGFQQNYGMSYDAIVNDTGGPTGINATINTLNIKNMFFKQVTNATTYAPGQPNAQIPAGTTGTANQQTGYTMALQYISLIWTVPKALFEALGGFGMLPDLAMTLTLMIVVGTVFYLASIVFFREL